MDNKQFSSKYEAQIKHLRNNYKRITIDFKIDDLTKFKNICKLKNTTPTFEIKNFVKSYINKYSNLV